MVIVFYIAQKCKLYFVRLSQSFVYFSPKIYYILLYFKRNLSSAKFFYLIFAKHGKNINLHFLEEKTESAKPRTAVRRSLILWYDLLGQNPLGRLLFRIQLSHNPDPRLSGNPGAFKPRFQIPLIFSDPEAGLQIL